METLNEFFATLIDAPLPSLLIIGGLLFLLLSVVSRVGALLVVTPAKQAQSALLGTLLLAGGLALHWTEQADAPDRERAQSAELTRSYITRHTWTFRHGEGDVISAHVELLASGEIMGIAHPNEARWTLENGTLVFLHENGEPSTRFTRVSWDGDRAILEGRLLLTPADERVVHVLVAHD